MFYVNTDCLDFTGIGQDKFAYDHKGNISINLFNFKNLTQTGLAIGKVSLQSEGNDWFSLLPDGYNFNMEKGGFSTRNVLTGLDWILHHPTIDPFAENFMMYFINPIYIPKVSTPLEPQN